MAVCFFAAASPSRGESFRLDSVGARGGLSLNQGTREFYEGEVFSNWDLPWAWDLGKGWHLQSRVELAGGWLGDVGKDAAMGTLGPAVALSWGRLPLTLSGGVGPTLISRHEFAEANLGMALQFTTHAELEWQFAPHWSLGYRFEHISNADLSPHNPGLSMHLLGLSYHF